MQRSHLIAYLLIAGAIGWLGGFLVGRRQPAAPAPAPAVVHKETLPGPPPPAPNPRDRVDQAIAAEDWKEAADAIDAMVVSGEPAWAPALDALYEILAVDDPVEFGVREEALDAVAKRAAFHKWAIPRARKDGSFAAELYLELAWGWLGEAGEGKYIFESLAGAGEEDLQRLLHALEGRVTPEMLPELAKGVGAAKNAQVQVLYLRVIASAGAAAEPVLKDLATSSAPLVAEGAAIALQMVKPPATGFLVLNVQGRGDRMPGNGGGQRPGMLASPVHRGDIITRVGDLEIDSEKAWRDAVAKFVPRGGMIEIGIVRKGEAMKVTVPAGAGAPKGKFVTAAR
ncbi:MAG: hypothetical protein HYY18_11820 [Planctomycetes bacterium]|nr:hypothetical protein [Planctomycetota bacterium]